jgi:PhzF family phenazine biosynthesis protein
LIPVKDRHILMSLNPNYKKIKAWSNNVNVNGFYVYTDDVIESSSTFHARSFNPRTGSNEDAATGVAAAALASHYARKSKFNGDVMIEQGDCMHQASRLMITIAEDKLKIGGYAVINMPLGSYDH